jgi:dTDP-glucose 4,6-dehydratase
VRDWLFVEDHVEALITALDGGRPGATYLVGGGAERRNIDLVRSLCAILDEEAPSADGSYDRLITFVRDRPGHDFRYAIDASATRRELGWAPRHTFETGLRETVRWYLNNQEWITNVVSGAYRDVRRGLAEAART